MCIKAAYQEAHSESSLAPCSNESSLATASRSRRARMAGIEAAAEGVAAADVARRQLEHVASWESLLQILSVNRRSPVAGLATE
jgi:hypothetical protein